MEGIKKCLVKPALFIFVCMCYNFHADASTLCAKNVNKCALYFDDSGYLTDRSNFKKIARIKTNNTFSSVEVYKYGNQYTLVQETTSNDKLVTIVPLKFKDKKWIYNSVYYFSVSLAASSKKPMPLWAADKISTRETIVANDIFEQAGSLPSKRLYYNHLPTGWPSTMLYVATRSYQAKGERCFAPFNSEGGSFPIQALACSFLKIPVANGDYEFSGNIDKITFVNILIKKNGDAFRGIYYDSRNSKKIKKVTGVITKDGRFQMKLFDELSVVTSITFRGSVINGRISGTSESAVENLRSSFSLYLQGFRD